MTEWSITSSTGTSGLIWAGSPPRAMMASRIAARSTTAGTPVKSCMSTRSGVKAISRAASPAASPWRVGRLGPAREGLDVARRVTLTPSSWRSRFSSSTLIEYGRRSTPRATQRVGLEREVGEGAPVDVEGRRVR